MTSAIETIETPAILSNADTMADAARKAVKAWNGADSTNENSAKAWGHAFLNEVISNGAKSDTLIGDTKAAIGWTKANKRNKALVSASAKNKLGRWFSDMRAILEVWGDLPDTVKAALLAGEASFLSALAAFNKAAKAAAKANPVDDGEGEGEGEGEGDTVQPSQAVIVNVDTINAMISALNALDDSELVTFMPQFAVLQALCDRAANAAIAASEAEPMAQAA